MQGNALRYITKILKTIYKQSRKGPMFNDCYKAPTTRTPKKRIKPETNWLQPGTLYQ
jgi:hypothetical protein